MSISRCCLLYLPITTSKRRNMYFRMAHEERNVHFFLDAFEDYIIRCLQTDYLCVILNYSEFSPEQKERLISYADKEIAEKVLHRMFEEIRNMKDKPRRFRALLDAVTDNEKVRLILMGKAIPSEDRGFRLLHNNAVRVCDQLDVEQILPYLLEKSVITDRDCEKIRAKNKTDGNWFAVPVLISRLHCKNPSWFQLFVRALSESGHDELADLLKTKYLEASLSSKQKAHDTQPKSLEVGHSESFLKNVLPDKATQSLDADRPRSSKTKLSYDRKAATAHDFRNRHENVKEAPSERLSSGIQKITLDVRDNGFSDDWLRKQNVSECWWPIFKEQIRKPYFEQLWQFIDSERKTYGDAVLPKPNEVFCWTNYCTLDEIKVVIMAENPTAGQTGIHGLAFSVEQGYPVQKYLSNIFQEVETDIEGFVIPQHGCLVSWAKQGVLLLNAVLTWRSDRSTPPQNLHKDHGWEVFTDEILSYISIHRRNVVFMFWGNYIQKKGQIVDYNHHCILKAAHPSRYSASKGFFGCCHFSRCNKYLQEHGKTPINWTDI